MAQDTQDGSALSDTNESVEGDAPAKGKGADDTSGSDKDEKESGKLNWFEEIKGLLVLIFIVLAVHTFVAKPFYIPSISMMPNLLIGDRLLVSKFPYGWSWVSPTFHVLPRMEGRLLGAMPKRGDIVIFVPQDVDEDWIKRVIAFPGETVELKNGTLFINNRPIKQETLPNLEIPIDANNQCDESSFPGALTTNDKGEPVCSVPIIRETLPNGVSYTTIDAKQTAQDNYGPYTVPDDTLFLMGDNRDNSSDSRVDAAIGGLGGGVPIENIGGRAEFITFSLDGTTSWNPVSWFTSFRSGRAGTSLRPAKAAPPETGPDSAAEAK